MLDLHARRADELVDDKRVVADGDRLVAARPPHAGKLAGGVVKNDLLQIPGQNCMTEDQ